MKKSNAGAFGRSKLFLAGLLSLGAIAPVVNQSPTSARGVGPINATVSAPSAQQGEKALPPAPGASSGQILSIIGGMGGDPYLMIGRAGLSPKDWGMSRACARMVRKNKGIARGISAQRL